MIGFCKFFFFTSGGRCLVKTSQFESVERRAGSVVCLARNLSSSPMVSLSIQLRGVKAVNKHEINVVCCWN